MLAFQHPPYQIRRAEPSETSLIAYLRLASLLCLEMTSHSLDAIKAVMRALPDVDADLVAAGRYFIADHGGDLIGGAGWSVLPLRFLGKRLRSTDGRPAALELDDGSILLRGFFLDPDAGRRGAGALLIAHIESEARRAGHSAAELLAPASSEVYYRSLGFRPVRRLALELGLGEVLPMLQMRRSFTLRLAAAA